MAAVAFKAVLKFSCQDGYKFQHPCTVSDVNAEYYVFPDGNGFTTLPSNHGAVYLVDVVLSAAGTDTTTADIFVNAKNTGERIMNSANLGTNFSRQFMGAPVGIIPGAQIRIKQNT